MTPEEERDRKRALKSITVDFRSNVNQSFPESPVYPSFLGPGEDELATRLKFCSYMPSLIT